VGFVALADEILVGFAFVIESEDSYLVADETYYNHFFHGILLFKILILPALLPTEVPYLE